MAFWILRSFLSWDPTNLWTLPGWRLLGLETGIWKIIFMVLSGFPLSSHVSFCMVANVTLMMFLVLIVKTEKKTSGWPDCGTLEDFWGCSEAPWFQGIFQGSSTVTKTEIVTGRLEIAREYHVSGPSKFLPPGSLLCCLRTKPFTERLRGAITDRRDFYHQCGVVPVGPGATCFLSNSQRMRLQVSLLRVSTLRMSWRRRRSFQVVVPVKVMGLALVLGPLSLMAGTPPSLLFFKAITWGWSMHWKPTKTCYAMGVY